MTIDLMYKDGSSEVIDRVARFEQNTTTIKVVCYNKPNLNFNCSDIDTLIIRAEERRELIHD